MDDEVTLVVVKCRVLYGTRIRAFWYGKIFVLFFVFEWMRVDYGMCKIFILLEYFVLVIILYFIGF